MSNESMGIETPEKITISKESGRLQIERRKWPSLPIFILIRWVIVVNVLLIGSYIIEFLFQLPEMASPLRPILGIPLMIGLAYGALVARFNKTVVDVDLGSLTIKHGPIPFWGNKKVPSKTLAQLYCKKDWHFDHRAYLGNTAHPYDYSIHGITNERKDIVLLTGFDSVAQARSIEREIESFLNIKDKPVKGEFM